MKRPHEAGIRRYKAPVTVAIAILIVYEVLTSAIRANFVDAQGLFALKAMLYFVLSLLSGCFYVYGVYRITRFHRNKTQQFTAAEKRSTLLISLSAASIFAFCILVLLVGATDLYDEPAGYFALRFLVSFCVYSSSYTQVLVLRPPGTSSSKSKAETTRSGDDLDLRGADDDEDDSISSSPTSHSNSEKSSETKRREMADTDTESGSDP